MVDEEWIAITCGTNPRPSLTALGAHCKYFNIPLYVARYGTVWGGWMTKLQVAEEIVNAELDLVLTKGKSIDTALADAQRLIARRAQR